MKKRMSKMLLGTLMGMLLLTGCGQASEEQQRTVSGTKSVNDILEEQTKTETSSEEVSPSLGEEKKEVMDPGDIPAYTTIDVDLTEMSSTLVYSEVLNIMTNPSAYIGKTIKMNGIADVYTDPATGITYRTCIIQDATACCAQGIEFELGDGSSVSAGDQVTVTGVFDTYMEGQYIYCTLRNAVRNS